MIMEKGTRRMVQPFSPKLQSITNKQEGEGKEKKV